MRTVDGDRAARSSAHNSSDADLLLYLWNNLNQIWGVELRCSKEI
jgi:hypothetical protein